MKLSLKQQTKRLNSVMVAADCIVIVDRKSVRLRGGAAHSPQASIFRH
jgi:hypothetical protein